MKIKNPGELQSKIKAKITLYAKLSKLKDYGLINVVPTRVGNRYASSYSITSKGRKILRLLDKIH
ncbi:MAG: hypothetical protein ACREBH_00480 [Candidatus Micrarchaeaceae archaeon]